MITSSLCTDDLYDIVTEKFYKKGGNVWLLTEKVSVLKFYRFV